MKLKYGKEDIQIPIQDKNIIQILNSSKQKTLLHPEDRLKEILKNPINSLSLKDLLIQKKAEKVLIIVNDITRPTPYEIILSPLLEELHQVGIKKENIIFVIATGSHRGNSKKEIMEIFGEDIAGCYKFINHDDQKSQMKDFGQFPRLRGGFCDYHRVIVPHYFAGFSGGRKSILPGICGRKTIETNHANMVDPDARAGNLKGNPVHEEMQEAAEKVGVDFNINVVTDENHQIIEIVAGELYASWLKGVEVCKKTYLCPIKHKAEVVITSPGGYPKDINVYQAQKALENAYQAVKPGGTIILFAECPEGYGQVTFERWIEEASSIDDIINRLKKKFVLGGHKAYNIVRMAKEVEVLLISSLPQDKVRKLFCIPMDNITSALRYVEEKHGEDFKAYILPLGNTVLPQLH